MPGKILEVVVSVGDQVKKEINVKASDSVETEPLMMVIE